MFGGRQENDVAKKNSVGLAWAGWLCSRLVNWLASASSRPSPFSVSSSRERVYHLRPTYVSMSIMEEHTNETMVQRDSSTSESPYAPQPETEASLVLKATANSYPFLVHSTDTLANNRPPNVDNKPLARQKRRRTR